MSGLRRRCVKLALLVPMAITWQFTGCLADALRTASDQLDQAAGSIDGQTDPESDLANFFGDLEDLFS